MTRKPAMIGVIGAAAATPRGLEHARQIGRLIAEQGAVLVCGGLGGIMEAASQGCCEAGGQVVGILPGNSAKSANPFVTIPVVTAMGHARNVILVQTADVVIAVEGGYGTLSEIAVARKIGKPVIQLDSWPALCSSRLTTSPEEAVAAAFAALAESMTDET